MMSMAAEMFDLGSSFVDSKYSKLHYCFCTMNYLLLLNVLMHLMTQPIFFRLVRNKAKGFSPDFDVTTSAKSESWSILLHDSNHDNYVFQNHLRLYYRLHYYISLKFWPCKYSASYFVPGLTNMYYFLHLLVSYYLNLPIYKFTTNVNTRQIHVKNSCYVCIKNKCTMCNKKLHIDRLQFVNYPKI